MFQVWVLFGSMLTMVAYVGLSKAALHNSELFRVRKANINVNNSSRAEYGIWITSKLFDLCSNFILYIVIGWGLAFGKDDGKMFAGSSQFFVKSVSDSAGGMTIVFFAFAVTSLSTVIVAEKIRHELDPLKIPYQIFMMICGGVIFPVVLHWAWSDAGWASPWRSSDQRALLFGCGALDTSGSGVVHLSAGLVSLGFVMAISNVNREDELGDLDMTESHYSASLDEKGHLVTTHPGADKHHLHLRTIGLMRSNTSTQHSNHRARLIKEQERRKIEKATQDAYMQNGISVLLVWLGSYGMGVVANLQGDLSTLEVNSTSVSRRVVNLTLAAAVAFLTSMVLSHFGHLELTPSVMVNQKALQPDQDQHDDATNLTSTEIQQQKESLVLGGHMGSILCAIVAAKAGCGVMALEGAAIVGVLGAVTHRLSCMLHTAWFNQGGRRTAREGGFTIHLSGGVLGLICVGFFATPAGYAELVTNALESQSVFYTTYNDASRVISLTNIDRSIKCSGLFYGGNGSTLAANSIFTLALLTWCFTIMFCVTKYLKASYMHEFVSLKAEFMKNSVNSLSQAFHDSNINGEVKVMRVDAEVQALVQTQSLENLSDYQLIEQMEREEVDLQLKLLEEAEAARGAESEIDTARSSVKALKKQKERQTGLYTSLKKQMTKKWKADATAHESSFQEEFGYNWDAVIIFPIHPEVMTKEQLARHRRLIAKSRRASFAQGVVNLSATPTREEIEDSEVIPPITCDEDLPSAQRFVQILREAGCETYQYYSVNKDKIICKIRVPLLLLRRKADLLNMKFLLNEAVLKQKAGAGFKGTQNGRKIKIAPFDIYDGFAEGVTTLRPYQYVYGTWDANVDSNLYQCAAGYDHEFGTLQRLSVIRSIVRSAIDETDDIDMFDDLIDPRKAAILAFFPLHDPVERDRLAETVFSMKVMPGKEPQDAVRNYYGEEIALYFKFLSHYTKFLGPLSVLGTAVFVYMLYLWGTGYSYYELLATNKLAAIFGICVCIWTTIMLKFWADHEKLYGLRWGTTEYEETESDLPSYVGEIKPSYITGDPMKIVDLNAQNTRHRVSWLIIATCSILVVCCFAATFLFKFWLIAHNYAAWSPLADVINAISIAVLDIAYRQIAAKLTSFENCRTQTEFNDSLITKLFLFGFCNSYAPIIYIAFVKKWVGDPCLEDSCMGELSQTLSIIFVFRSLLGHSVTYFLPKLKYWYAQCAMRKAVTKTQDNMGLIQETVKRVDELELEYLKVSYDDVFTDYNEISVQFGFLALFVAAFPLAPLLAMCSNFVEDRVDGWKLLHSFRRPWPTASEDIGSWYEIFTLVSVLGVFFNAGIVCWTMEIFDGYTASETVFAYVLFCIICFAARYLIVVYNTSTHELEVEIQLARQKHLTKKIIEQVPDDLDLEKEMGEVTAKQYYLTNNKHLTYSDAKGWIVHEVDEEIDSKVTSRVG